MQVFGDSLFHLVGTSGSFKWCSASSLLHGPVPFSFKNRLQLSCLQQYRGIMHLRAPVKADARNGIGLGGSRACRERLQLTDPVHVMKQSIQVKDCDVQHLFVPCRLVLMPHKSSAPSQKAAHGCSGMDETLLILPRCSCCLLNY